MEISETTKKLYASHARRFDRWINSNGRPAHEPGSWVEALDVLTKRLGRRSWRLYRNAITWHLRGTYGPDHADHFLVATGTLEKPPEKKRKLARHIDPVVMMVLVAALRRRRGSNGKRLADLMIAMVLTGIRQREWTATTLSADRKMLTIRNAKYRPDKHDVPGRGNGEVRQLILDDDIPGPLMGSIVRTVDWLHGRHWPNIAANINRIFRSTVKDCRKSGALPAQWEKVRVYDCRHQFSADAKAGLSLLAGEVAAAMGHRSVVTAISHYGKRKHATGGRSVVRPSAASVAAVSHDSIGKAQKMIGRTQEKLQLAGRVQYEKGNPETDGMLAAASDQINAMEVKVTV